MNGNQVDTNLPIKKSGSLSPIASQDEEDIEIVEKSKSEPESTTELEMKPSICKLPTVGQLEDRQSRAEETYNKILKEIHGHHYLMDELRYNLKTLHSQYGQEQEIRKMNQALEREKIKIDSLENKALLIHKRLLLAYLFNNRIMISSIFQISNG